MFVESPLSDVPRHLHIQPRQAEVLLNRLMTDCCNRVRAFHDGMTKDHMCVKWSLLVRETVEHCIPRCPGRAKTRRHVFGRLERGTTVESLCKKHPTAILEFMHEGILHEARTTLESAKKKKKKKARGWSSLLCHDPCMRYAD